jgi:1-acyl-sn-glycerol-3-phosphate acyltransferase
MAFESNVRGTYPEWVSKLAGKILRALGWTTTGQRPDCPRCVITCYPHETNWDLPYALLTAMELNIPVVYTMKKEWFRGPLGVFFKWTGGVPIDRSRSGNVVRNIAEEMHRHPIMFLLIPPEGTRKNVEYWKMGFYWIALTAGVPILPSYVDYKNKRAGVGEPLVVDGNIAADFEKIRDFYVSKVGRCGELPPKYLGEAGQALATSEAASMKAGARKE